MPAVDVAAVMLVFFLLSGGFLLQPGIAVKLPTRPSCSHAARSARGETSRPSRCPAIYFDNRKVDAHELDALLANMRESARTIIIKADRRAPVDLLVQVTNVAVTRGFSVVLATAEKPWTEHGLRPLFDWAAAQDNPRRLALWIVVALALHAGAYALFRVNYPAQRRRAFPRPRCMFYRRAHRR